MTLINSSLLLNMNYFSLWMMEPLGTTSESPSQQYNITVQMVSCFFLLSAVGFYLTYRIFKATSYACLMSKTILMAYGIGLAFCYWHY